MWQVFNYEKSKKGSNKTRKGKAMGWTQLGKGGGGEGWGKPSSWIILSKIVSTWEICQHYPC